MNEEIQPNQELGGQAVPPQDVPPRSQAPQEPGNQDAGGNQSGQADAESEIGLKSPRMRIAQGILHVQVPISGKDMIWICGWLQFSLIPWVQMQFMKAIEQQEAAKKKIIHPGGNGFINNLRGFMKRR